MISIENLSKSFGDRTLFEALSFKINPRERVGLVGRNGHGKTTLLNILSGKQAYDTGTISMPKNYRIGYVRQHIAFTQSTVLEEGAKGLPTPEKDQLWKVEKVLTGLGFSTDDMQRNPHEFSGGFQVRLNLAKVLVSEPDLLLLDEPTNYLDITSIRWIIKFLLMWPSELLLITHDRSFMDKLVTHTVGIHRKKARKIKGDTEKYYARIAQDEEVYEKTRLNDERKAKEVRQFITRFRAKARLANLVQSRIKTLEKMEKKNKLDAIRTLDFSFKSAPFRGKQVLNVEQLSFGFDPSAPLFKNLDFTISAGERICVVGKNGKGKTTLLKILAGKLTPDKGTLTYNPQVIKGVFEQTNIKTLVDSRTVEEEISCCAPDVERQLARNICGAMMFEGDTALKKISVLSGGEKSRVMLGKLLVTPVNLLLLDEPTNHLDMDSCDALLAALDNFAGTAIMVTHNEMFLHAIADRLIVFHDEGASVFEGGYAEFLEKDGWGDKNNVSGKTLNEDPSEKQQEEKRSKKALRKMRSEIITEKSKQVRPLEKAIEEAEKKIEADEARLEDLNDQMLKAMDTKNGVNIGDLSRKIHKCQQSIDENFEQMEKLDDKRRVLEEKFNKKLDALMA